MKVNGIFITKLDKECCKLRFDTLSKKYGSKTSFYSGVSRQKITNFKVYCNDIINVLQDVFYSEMHGTAKCIRRLKGMVSNDDINRLDSNLIEILDLIIELNKVIDDAVPIKDLPSCKALTELSMDDAISVAKDLSNSELSKGFIGVVLLGKKIGDAIKISDVREYYTSNKEQLLLEIAEEKRFKSEIEIFLLEKYDAEIGYCDLAYIKTGVTAVGEILELKKLAEKNIAQFEFKKDHNNTASFNI